MPNDLPEVVPTPAFAADLPQVLALLGVAGLPTEGVADAFPGGYALIRDGELLLGVAGLETYDDVALLRSVAVAPDLRGRGFGRVLVTDRLRAAAQARIRYVYLLTTTAADYFRSMDFRDVARSQAPVRLQQSSEFASICPASAACLARAP